jgi:catechol 2,3-dioxygenase-like lactoylglutathione lyase family enzyme
MTARRAPMLAAVALWLAAVAAARAQAPAASAAGTGAPAVTAIVVPVADLDAAVQFYTGVLAFRVVDQRERQGTDEERLQGVFGLRTTTATLTLGDERVELVEFQTPRGRPLPGDTRSNDRWFQHLAIVVRDMDAAYAVLRAHRVRHVSPAPQTLPAWNPAAAGIRAFYFLDPDGHPLELLQFPSGKGAAKWHAPGDALFLGIDHTAIVVADTDAALRCWRDELGLRVVGDSDNHGPEQDRLNHVFGARLRITTLRGTAGPGVELLEYVTPRSGRPYPEDTAANDLWSLAVVLHCDDVAARWQRFAGAGRAVSPGAVAFDGAAHALVRDADGHRVRLRGSPAAAAPR